MKKKTFQFTKNIKLKLVDIRDASFILSLRTNKDLNKYINPTSKKISDQVLWMKNYFNRNKQNLEYYFKFIIKKKNKTSKFGVARIIKLNKKNFSFGSWIIKPNQPNWYAIEAVLSIYKFAFEVKKFKKNKMWMDLKNHKIYKFHTSMGAKEIKRDKKQVYLDLNIRNYNILKKKFAYFFI